MSPAARHVCAAGLKMRHEVQVELTKPDYVVGLEALIGKLVKRDSNAARRINERLGTGRMADGAPLDRQGAWREL
jgi:hypothetical protein